MKKIPRQTVLLMLWPYVALGLNVFLIRFGLLAWLFGGLLTLLLLAVNIRCAWRMKDAAHLSVLAMCVKITHIGAYAASAFLCGGLFAAIPLVLGSLIGLVCMLPYPLLMAARIKDEEALLCKELPGYEAYRRKVRWRMLPLIW